MIGVIASREFRALFRSPAAWIIAALMQITFAWMFLLTLEEYLSVQATLKASDESPGVTAYMTFRFMAPASALFLLLCPLLSMRTFSDEFRLQTFPLLLSSPISITSIVLGKFLGTMALVAVLAVLVTIMPATLALISGIDLRTLLLALCGLIALGCCATAVGIFFSSLTRHTMIAAISSIATLLFLWILGKGSFTSEWVSDAFAATALSTHLAQIFQGTLNTREAFYFAIVTTLFLTLTTLRIDSYKYGAT